jgi:uncharacterized membrane protein YoaT (DUF817 family)
MKPDSLYLLLLYLSALVLIIYFRRDEWMMLAVLATAFLIAVTLYKVNVLAVLIIAVFFFTVENICAYYGLWKYNNTKFPMPYVPVWVYFAWALSVVFIMKMMEIVKRNKLEF